MSRPTLLVLVFLLCQHWLYSQQVVTHFTSFNSDLPYNTVRCFEEAEDGTIWMGTDVGLAKYQDGNWTTYLTTNSSLPDSDIRSLLAAEDGTLYIGTFQSGLVIYDGTTWDHFHIGNSPLPDNQVKALAFDHSNNLWVGTTGGLAKYDGMSWTIWDDQNSLFESNNITCITVGSDSTVMVGTLNGGMVFMKDTAKTIYTKSNSFLEDNTILSIEENGTDRWILTPVAGIYVMYSPTNVSQISLTSGLPTTNLTDQVVMDDGSVWISSASSGIFNYDWMDWEIVDSTNSELMRNQVLFIEKDTDGNIWGGTIDAGIFKLDMSQYLSRSTSAITSTLSLFPNPTQSFLQINGITGPASLQITSSSGKVYWASTNYLGEPLSVSNLLPGYYIATVIQNRNFRHLPFVKN